MESTETTFQSKSQRKKIKTFNRQKVSLLSNQNMNKRISSPFKSLKIKNLKIKKPIHHINKNMNNIQNKCYNNIKTLKSYKNLQGENKDILGVLPIIKTNSNPIINTKLITNKNSNAISVHSNNIENNNNNNNITNNLFQSNNLINENDFTSEPKENKKDILESNNKIILEPIKKNLDNLPAHLRILKKLKTASGGKKIKLKSIKKRSDSKESSNEDMSNFQDNQGKESETKVIKPQNCDVIYFFNTKNIYLYIKNSNTNIINENPNLLAKFPYKIIHNITIPKIFKMRMNKYENMPKCITDTCAKAEMKYTKNQNNCNVLWRLYGPTEMRDLVQKIHKNQKYNHFPTTFQLGRKDNLYRHYHHFSNFFPTDYNFAPPTYILPFDGERFEKDYKSSSKKIKWIVKPVNLSRGRGIHLLQNEEEFKRLQKASAKLNVTQYLISRYISNPHLINKKKYDLRIYVLITSFNPLRIYLYNNGLVRFATEEYQHGNYQNIYIHLTNYSINKNNIKYKSNNCNGGVASSNIIKEADNEQIENMDMEDCQEDVSIDFTGNVDEMTKEQFDENASKWSLPEYKEYFIKNNQLETFNKIWKGIKDIVIKTIITAADCNNRNTPTNKYQSLFELYGFDILVDSKFKTWLIEVNVNPSLHCTSPLDLSIKTDLISDIFSIIGIVPYHHNITNVIFNKNIDEYLKKDQNKNNNLKEINENIYENNNDNNTDIYGIMTNGSNKSNSSNNNINNLFEFTNASNKNQIENLFGNRIKTTNEKNRIIKKSNSSKDEIILNNNPNDESYNKGSINARHNVMKEFHKNNYNLKLKLDEFNSPYYVNMINYFGEEFCRSKLTYFDLIFPVKNNIEYYSQFLIKEGINDGDVALWQYLLSHDIV